MEETVEKFMGSHLTLPQVRSALTLRGFDLRRSRISTKRIFAIFWMASSSKMPK